MLKRLDVNEVTYDAHLNMMETTMNTLLKEFQQVRAHAHASPRHTRTPPPCLHACTLAYGTCQTRVDGLLRCWMDKGNCMLHPHRTHV
jgi:hypothetical protein